MRPDISRIQPLDGVRGLAALLVMFYWYLQQGGGTAYAWLGSGVRYITLGQTGVDLFFVLSGFLITRILIATKREKNYFKSFYMRRVLRILPLYYLFLVIYYFVLPFWRGTAVIPIEKSWYYWCYLQNLPAFYPEMVTAGPVHYWSLAVEEHFYLLWPLLIRCVPERHLGKVCWAVVAAAALFRYRSVYVDSSVVMQFTLYRMDALALGGLLAYYEWRGELTRKGEFFLVVMGVSALFTLTYSVWFMAESGLSGIVLKYFFIALFYWGLVGAVLAWRKTRVINALFSNRCACFTGKISYGLYIYHMLGFELARHFFPQLKSAWWGLPVSFAVVFIVAWISYRLFETPFLSLKERFAAVPGLISPTRSGRLKK